MGQMIDELVEQEYPEHYDEFYAGKERFIVGWRTLHSAMFPDELPPGLTAREYEVAKLAAAGPRNGEIAARLMVTENTVRFHLRAIFQKLDIDRRARLAEKLK